MGRITIAVYRPKKGREDDLAKLVGGHIDLLKKENLVTARKPVVMQAADGTIIEVFEWRSKEAIQQAHTNQEVGRLWSDFNEVCEYLKPVDVKEFHDLFSEFQPIN